MKLERKFAEDLMSDAKARCRGAVVLKTADRFTTSIPDVEILWLDRTSWFELKRVPSGVKLKKVVRMDQLVMGHELGQVCGGRAWTVIFQEDPERTEVWLPRTLAQHVWPQLVGECQADPREVDPLVRVGDFQQMILRAGCLWVPGWNNDLPLRILFDAMKASK